MSDLTIPKKLLEKKEKTYPVQITTPAEKITEFTLQLDAGLARTNDTANNEAARLQAQARLLLEQAQLIEWQADIRQKIRSSSIRFKPAVHQDYYLYENSGDPQLTMISPDEWAGPSPYGACLGESSTIRGSDLGRPTPLNS
jgi:hypothetical protein